MTCLEGHNERTKNRCSEPLFQNKHRKKCVHISVAGWHCVVTKKSSRGRISKQKQSQTFVVGSTKRRSSSTMIVQNAVFKGASRNEKYFYVGERIFVMKFLSSDEAYCRSKQRLWKFRVLKFEIEKKVRDLLPSSHNSLQMQQWGSRWRV